MKTRNLLWAALSMTAALVMTACSSEDNAVESPSTAGTMKTIPYTVTVGQGEAAATRATVDDDLQTLRFAEGDKLYISCDSRDDLMGILTLKSGDEGKTSGATFEGELTYRGDEPESDLDLKATLVGSSNVGVKIGDDEMPEMMPGMPYRLSITYPTTAYCSDVNDAVEKYSNLTGTSTFGAQSFSLTQQTAFLNFVITLDDGTATGATLPVKVGNGGSAICAAWVTTATEDEKVVAKFVLPVAKGTTLSSATVTMGGNEPIPFGASQTLEAKVYNVKRTQEAPAPRALAEATTGDIGKIVGADGKIYATKAAAEAVATGNAVAMIAYVGSENGLALALADDGQMDWPTAKSTCEGKTPVVTGAAWMLPSDIQWQTMFEANDNSVTSYGGLNTAITNAGGTALQKVRYWSSSSEYGVVSLYRVDLRDDGIAYFGFDEEANANLVRACLAFNVKQKTLADATIDDIGKIAGADGYIYATKAAAEAVAAGNAVAMIAYVGSGSDCTHGLAIQLSSSPEKKNWSEADTYAAGFTAVPGGTWRLPSKADWQNMFLGCAVPGDALSASDEMNPIEGFKAKIAATGIAWQSDLYWSSTTVGSDGACSVRILLGDEDTKAQFYIDPKYHEFIVLPCLAF